MNSKPYVVMGEAQESESEEEIDSSALSVDDLMKQSKGKIVFGEAPESDDECCGNMDSVESVSSAVSALSAPTITKKKSTRKPQSILVKKLYERNASLYKNLTEFVEQTAKNVGNELNTTNKRLLKCQLQLQESADYLRILNCNLTVLDSNLQMLLSTKYLPNIKINENIREELKGKPP